MSQAIIALVVIAILLLIIVPATVRIVQEYERGVIFRLGRLVGARGPGIFLLIPFVERMVKVDLRVLTMDVPAQEAITSDNVTVKVDAVIYFRVMNPSDAVTKVADYIRATSLISQTTLRSIVGQSHFDELLSQREQINLRLQKVIDEQTDPWGIKVSMVEIKNVEIPEGMQRAMARQAEAERERRAKIIHAEGEFQAAEQLAAAARVISADPAAIQLRYLSTLTEMATEKTSTVVFPVPIDIVSSFMNMVRPSTPPATDGGSPGVPPTAPSVSDAGAAAKPETAGQKPEPTMERGG